MTRLTKARLTGQVPDVTLDLVRSGSVPGLGDITSNLFGESLCKSGAVNIWSNPTVTADHETHVVLQEPNGLRHKTSSDQEQETGRNNQEPVQGEGGTSSVDQVSCRDCWS